MRIFRAERDEVAVQWRILHGEELTELYCSTDKIEKHEMGGACSTYEG